MNAWMLWAAAAVAVFVAEMFIGSMYLLVLSAALAGAAAAAAFFGIGATGSILIAAVLSVVGTLWVYHLRREPSQRRSVADSNDLDLGAHVVVETALPDRCWRVRYRGAVWEARTEADHVFAEGESAKIVGRDGIVLLIRPL